MLTKPAATVIFALDDSAVSVLKIDNPIMPIMRPTTKNKIPATVKIRPASRRSGRPFFQFKKPLNVQDTYQSKHDHSRRMTRDPCPFEHILSIGRKIVAETLLRFHCSHLYAIFYRLNRMMGLCFSPLNLPQAATDRISATVDEAYPANCKVPFIPILLLYVCVCESLINFFFLFCLFCSFTRCCLLKIITW